MATAPAAVAMAEATLGSLKVPPPKNFHPKGRDSAEDTAEFETYSRQLKAFLSMQSKAYKEYMNQAERHPGHVYLPAEDEIGKELATQLQNFLILTCNGKATRIVCRDDSDENGFESWRRLHARYAPNKRVKHIGHMQGILTWKFSEANRARFE